MAIDLIVQHVHSQLEEVRAAWSPGCQWWGRPCPCSGGIAASSALGAEVGMAWLPSVLQACEPRGCPHEALPATLPPFQRRRLPRPCALVSARLLCELPSLPARASPLGTNQPSSSDLSDVPSLPAALLGLASPQTRNTSALWLWLLLFTPLRALLHSLSSQEPTFPLLCWVQPMGFKTQSLVMFYPQPEPRSRHMLHHFPLPHHWLLQVVFCVSWASPHQ